jgi:hypothetical protein
MRGLPFGRLTLAIYFSFAIYSRYLQPLFTAAIYSRCVLRSAPETIFTTFVVAVVRTTLKQPTLALNFFCFHVCSIAVIMPITTSFHISPSSPCGMSTRVVMQ